MSNEVYEKIVVKPPIDLIPDEYEIPEKIGVYTFTSNTKSERDSAQLFRDTLKDGYKVEEDTHCLDSENFQEILAKIKQDVEGLSGLILFFSCSCKHDGMIKVLDGEQCRYKPIQDVVREFTSYACLGLKNKPKVFIFHVKSPSLVQTDGNRYGTLYDVTYDTPGEADMLIVYKKSEHVNSLDFTQNLCKSIEEFGNVEDLVSLVTCLEHSNDDSRPLLVSTLTRKFYLTPSEHRGHHFHINQHKDEITSHLDDIKNNLSKVSITGKTNKSITGNSKRTSVSDAKPKYIKKAAGTSSSSNLPASTTVSDGGGSKNIAQTDTRGSRSRLVSTTAADGGGDIRGSRGRLPSVDDRPRWRY